MIDYPDGIYWSPISISVPPNNQLVAIKMMEPRGYRYAIGWYSKEERDFVLVAEPETDAQCEAIGWIALPKRSLSQEHHHAESMRVAILRSFLQQPLEISPQKF